MAVHPIRKDHIHKHPLCHYLCVLGGETRKSNWSDCRLTTKNSDYQHCWAILDLDSLQVLINTIFTLSSENAPNLTCRILLQVPNINFQSKVPLLHSSLWWACLSKVHIFWEGHKILQNLHLTFVKSKVKISQNFVAFSEYMNFKHNNNNSKFLSGCLNYAYFCPQIVKLVNLLNFHHPSPTPK